MLIPFDQSKAGIFNYINNAQFTWVDACIYVILCTTK